MKKFLPFIALFLVFTFLVSTLVYWLMMNGLSSNPTQDKGADESGISATSSSQTGSIPKQTTIGSVQTIAPAIKPNPPPPLVFWSKLTYELFSSEQERAEIIVTLLEKFPPTSSEQLVELPMPPSEKTNEQATSKEATENEKINDTSLSTSTLSSPVDSDNKESNTVDHQTVEVKPEPQEGWANVGQQMFALETQREEIVNLIAGKAGIERHSTSTTLPSR